MSATRIAHPALYPHHHWPRFLFNHTVCHVVIYRLKYELHAIEMKDNYRAVSEVSAAVENLFLGRETGGGVGLGGGGQ